MADSNVDITAGSGTSIDTRTEATNGHHRQVVVLGDPATNAGVAPVDATAGLKVDLGADNDITGTVTANLGAVDNAVLDNIDADTSAIQTAVELLDDAVYTDGTGTPSKALGIAGTDGTNPQIIKTDSSGELQVDVLSSALPSGASTSAKQDTVIGHLDGVEGLLGTIDTDTGNIATNTTDVPNVIGTDGAAGPTKVVSVGGTQATGEIQEIQVDADGQLQVDVLTMPTVTVTATNLDVQSGGADLATSAQGSAIQTAVELIDDTVKTLGTDTYTEATTKGVVIGAVRRDADTTLANTTNEVAPLQVDANGYLKVEIFDGGGSHTIDATELTAIQTAVQVMDDWDNGASDGASVSGDVAHDTADAGEPVKVGMKAVALKANPTEVAANDRTNWHADVSGVPFVLGGHPNILSQSLQVTDADGAQTDAAIITAGANVAVVLTKISVMADNANTGDVSVRIGFGTANTPAADAAQVVLFHPGLAPGTGVVEGTGSGIIGIGASGEDLRITCEDPAGGSINVIATYFTTDI